MEIPHQDLQMVSLKFQDAQAEAHTTASNTTSPLYLLGTQPHTFSNDNDDQQAVRTPPSSDGRKGSTSDDDSDFWKEVFSDLFSDNTKVSGDAAEPANDSKRSVTANTTIPDSVIFLSPDPTVAEDNLPYEMSLIEAGTFRRDPKSGLVVWNCKVNTAPIWNDANGNPYISAFTQQQMRYIPDLPNVIPPDAPGWQLVLYIRQAAMQHHLEVRYQDLFDRMDKKIHHSTLSNRMGRWLGSVGALSLTTSANFGWPSKSSIDSVLKLSYYQRKLNTWWDVEYIKDQDVFMVTQPKKHTAYREPFVDSKPERPFYLVEYHHHLEASERVNFIYDAIMFLSVKAEDEDFSDGMNGLLSWLTSPPADEQEQQLKVDVELDFKRWAKGCRDSIPAVCIELALAFATTPEEVAALKAADYSLSPDLLIAEILAAEKEVQATKDEDATRKETGRKYGERKGRADKKRKAEESDDEEGRDAAAADGVKKQKTN